MKWNILANNEVLEVTIDEELYVSIREHASWFASYHLVDGVKKGIYMCCHIPNAGIQKNKRKLLHRHLYATHIGDIPDGMLVDHVNGNSLDNRLCNLRLVDKGTNCANLTSSSKYIGVHRLTTMKNIKWQARVPKHMSKDGKLTYLGQHDTELGAAKAISKFCGFDRLQIRACMA